MKGKRLAVISVIGLLLIPAGAFALDTTETFDVGFTDLELYFSAANIGKGEDAVYSFNPLFGIGLVDRLSFCIGTVWESSYDLVGSLAEFSTALLGTPLDTGHFDIDLWGGVADNFLGDEFISAFVGGEINVDFEHAGIYLRPEFGWTRTIIESEELGEAAGEEDEYQPKEGLVYSIDGALGAYANVGEKIQVFAEYGQAFERTEDEYDDIGKYFALGVNWTFLNTAELITEVGWSTDNEEDSYYASAGVIFTIEQK